MGLMMTPGDDGAGGFSASPDLSNLSMAQRVAMLPEDERERILAGIDPEELMYDWTFWARPNQFFEPSDLTWSLALLLAGRGFGKLLDVGTMVPTPSGWTTMGELRDGDTVFDEHGHPTTVLMAHTPETPEKAYRIHFSDGTYIDAGSEHLWVTWTHQMRKTYLRANGNPTEFPEDWASWRHDQLDRWGNVRQTIAAEVIDTQRMYETQTHGKRDDRNHCIPVAGALDLPDAHLPIDPYLLGYWLGDGDSRGGHLTVGVQDIDNFLSIMAARGVALARVTPILEKNQYRIHVEGLTTLLRAVGLLHNKHIPTLYLRASTQQRTLLLRGLMDSDGTASNQGNRNVEFCSTLKVLADGVLELARSLSIRAVTYEGRAMLNGRDCGPKYRVCWTSTQVNPFALQRKAALAEPIAGKQGLRLRHRMVTKVEPLDDIPLMRCITVDSPNSMYLVGEAMIPTHNTRLMSEWVRQKATTMPGSRGIIMARTTADVRDVMVSGDSGIINVHPPGERPEYMPSKRLLVWPNGTTALLLSAEVPDQARGPQSHWSACDEVATWPQTPDSSGLTAWDNVRIATRLGKQPQIMAATTPKRTAFMKELVAEIEEHPDTMQIRKGKTADNMGNLSQAYVSAIVGKYEGTSLARQELDGEMVDSFDGALFTGRMLDETRMSALPAGLVRAMTITGVDPSVAENPKDECGIITIIGTLEPDVSKRHIFIMADATVKGSPGVWAPKVAETAMTWGSVVVAETNQGGALVTSAVRNVNQAVRIFPVHSYSGKALRAESLVLAWEQGRVHIIGELLDLEEQLLSWDPVTSKKSPDRLDALVHAANAVLLQENSKKIGAGAGVRASRASMAAKRSGARNVAVRDASGRMLSSMPSHMRNSVRGMFGN